MAQAKRRARIVELLKQAGEPVTGSHLSSVLGVTRQVIVADIAVLRASGKEIIATPRGYLWHQAPYSDTLHRSTVAVYHSDRDEDIAGELNLIVDLGGRVVDVIVEHPLYGELTGSLQIKSRRDVAQFVEKLAEQGAEPLLVLTGGYHLHTVETSTAEAMEEIRSALRRAGYLAE